EYARTLEHDVHAHLFPWQPARLLFTQQSQPMLANRQVPVVGGPNRLFVSTVNGVVSHEVLDALGTADIVRGDEVETGCVHHDLERGSSDPSQPVDSDVGHEPVLLPASTC